MSNRRKMVMFTNKITIELYMQCGSKNQDTRLLSVTSPNVDGFSKFFH